MKKTLLFAAALVLSLALNAQEALQVHYKNGMVAQYPIAHADRGNFSVEALSLLFAAGEQTLDVAAIDSIKFAPCAAAVEITWATEGVRVLNPYGFDVKVSVEGGDVVVNSACGDEVRYVLSGTGRGSFKLYSVKKQVVALNGLHLTAETGPALNIQSKKRTEIHLPAGTVSTLSDATLYNTSAEEDAKAALFAEGQLVFTGTGEMHVSGHARHAIASDDYILVENGRLFVEQAATDGVHAKDYFEMTGGNLEISGTGGDCIDGDTGYVRISGGTLKLFCATADTKAVKCDSLLHIEGGELTVTVSGNQGKGLKSAQKVQVSGGKMNFVLSGGAVLVNKEPSYCTAVKCDGDIVVEGGEMHIQHTGAAGKGLSADGSFIMTDGVIEGTFSGNGSTYTNSSNQSDTYGATGVKSDGEMNLFGGTLTITCTGTGGKGVSAGGVLTVGETASEEEGEGPVLNITTSGAALGSSSTSGGGGRPGGPGGGGWPGGPGGSNSSAGGKSKAVRGAANVTVNAGHLTLKTSTDGAEGLESKATMTINGGLLEIETYDDALNAAKNITFNGGKVFAYASGNDGIDSNGTLTVNGGLIVSSGDRAPEEGFDCDQNTFTITGGTFIGMGGATSSPTTSKCTQCVVKYSNASATNGLEYTLVRNSDGKHVMSFKILRAYSSATLLFTSPEIQKGTGYTLYTGSSVSGGTTFHGLTTGATVSGGTQKKTFTPSSYSTTL